MALLWPERGLASSRRLLNLGVHVLRSALGEGAISSTNDGLLLNPSHLACDLHALRVAIASDASERVVQLYAGTLLDGFHLGDSIEFGYWLDERRNELAHAYVSALVAVARRQEESGDSHGRVRTCRKLVAADPHSGPHAQALMRALDAAGDRAAAIHHATEHARRVHADLGLDPDEGVLALARRLRGGGAGNQPPPGVAVDPRVPSVGVLPFLALGGDPENAHFADGITEDVIAHLSKIRALKVISRASVMPFKQRQPSLKEIGATLSVATLLDGSIRCIGDRVRIVATLIDAATDQHLWAETYDRQLTDIFAIQTDVALQIAAALRAGLSPDERQRVRREQTHDLHAYQLFLQGQQWFDQDTPECLARAIEYFDRAIARDPTFALASARLANVHVSLAELGAMAPDHAYRRASEAVTRALRLDPVLAPAHSTKAFLKAVLEFDWPGAEESFKRALDLSPSDADIYNQYARFCAALARHDEAIALHRHARDLAPLVYRNSLVTTLLRAGQNDEAVAEAEALTEIDPGDERTWATLGWAYFLSGRRDEGLAQLERAVGMSPTDTMWLGQLGEAFGMAGNAQKAHETLTNLEQRARTTFVSPFHFTYVYTGLGDFERAMDWLERAVASRSGPAYGIKGSFLLAPLHSHPRFRALLRQMKLE
jgi:TolB-like protein/DNA-binding SARP family transcriptional activator